MPWITHLHGRKRCHRLPGELSLLPMAMAVVTNSRKKICLSLHLLWNFKSGLGIAEKA
jgi:hypothetical protein